MIKNPNVWLLIFKRACSVHQKSLFYLAKGLFWHVKQVLLQSIDNEMVKEYGRICLIRSHLNTTFLYINKVEDEANGI
jgi:hypothetical protein